MNFIFRTYPTHPWITDWPFEPRNCSSAFRQNTSHQFFRSLQTVGHIGPNTASPAWRLQIPVPQNSHINLLFNGFCSYIEQGKKDYTAEVLVPEPGVLWGRVHGIPLPQLATDLELLSDADSCWLENGNQSAYLSKRDNLFCLVTKSAVQDDAKHIANDYLDKNISDALSHERTLRSGTDTFFVDMTHHDTLAAICMESMMRALRPPEGNIPYLWSQSSHADTAKLDINELFPLALAWSMVDSDIAEELVHCALKIQSNAGAIPVSYAPHASFSLLESPKPLITKTAEAVWSVRKDEAFLDQILPLLRRHLQWLLHHYDPKQRGLYCWKNSSEPLFPDAYKTDLSTVDLTTLLLTEIEAYNRLCRSSAQYGALPAAFKEEHETLENNLLNHFWNAGDLAFSNAFIHDTQISMKGSCTLLPLLWNSLPMTYKDAILGGLSASDTLPGDLNVLSWSTTSIESNGFPLLQHFVLLQCLKQGDSNGSLLSDFTRITLQGFLEWHTLSINQTGHLHLNPVTAAYILNIQATRQYRYIGEGPITGFFFRMLKKFKADVFDLLIIAVTLFGIFGTHAIYDAIRTPPPLDILTAEMNQTYEEKNIRKTLQKCHAIIQHYPNDAGRARLLIANIYILQGQLNEARKLYQQIRQDFPDSPGPMISLGLICQMQGEFTTAEQNYEEFCYLFEEIFPGVVEEVNRYRDIMREGFNSPPKWKEIYRYQLMHEL